MLVLQEVLALVVQHVGVEQAKLGDDQRLVLLVALLHPGAHGVDLLAEDAHAVVFRAAMHVRAWVVGRGVGRAQRRAERDRALGA